MSFLTAIKRNPILRGAFNCLEEYFGVWKCRLGYAHKTAILIPPMHIKGHKNIYLHAHANIDAHATILSTRAKFIMEYGATAATGLTVVTGDHHHIPGRFSFQVTDADKPAESDQDVVVGEDALLSAHVTLLKGVHIGRGAIVGAGAVVTKSIPHYAIAVGVPAKVVGFKFNPDEVRLHEEKLYPAEKRIDFDEYRKLYDAVMTKNGSQSAPN